MRNCSKCNQQKYEDEFAWRYDRGQKRRRGTCIECHRKLMNKSLARPSYKIQYNARRRERRLEKAKYLFDYLSEHQCPCGVNDPFVLQFDHVRGEKLFNLSAEIREKSFDDIKKEIEKCDIICGNCHMRKTRSDGLIWVESYQNKPWLLTKRQKIRDYLLMHPCVGCAESDPAVLEFDHVRGEKSFTISVSFCDRPWQLIEDEIQKCDIRCTNCHLRRTIATSDNYNWYKVIAYKELQWQEKQLPCSME